MFAQTGIGQHSSVDGFLWLLWKATSIMIHSTCSKIRGSKQKSCCCKSVSKDLRLPYDTVHVYKERFFHCTVLEQNSGQLYTCTSLHLSIEHVYMCAFAVDTWTPATF